MNTMMVGYAREIMYTERRQMSIIWHLFYFYTHA